MESDHPEPMLCPTHRQRMWGVPRRCWRCATTETAPGPLSLQMQPKASRVCGQTVVAMLVGEPVEHVITQRFGHRHSTSGRELRCALALAGQKPAEKWRRLNGVLPLESRGVVSLRCFEAPRHRWKHWVCVAGGVLYDPSRGWAYLDDPFGALEHLGYPLGSVKAISYLEVKTP